MEKKTSIGFASELVPIVMNGEKTLTYRLGNKYANLQPGDTLEATDSSTGEVISRISIVSMDTCRFEDLPIDREGHEKYETKDHQKKVFEKYYPNQVKDDSTITIIEFNLV